MAKKQENQIVEKEANTALSTNVDLGINLDVKDMMIPRLNIVQLMSQSEAKVGTVLYDKTYELAASNTPLHVIPVAVIKGWKENIPYGEEEVPRIALTEEAAKQLKEDSDYKVIEYADFTFLIRQPEEGVNDDAFQLPIGDHSYALGRLYVSKIGFRNTYMRLATNVGLTQKPISYRVWKLHSEELTQGKNTWYSPSMTATKELTDEAVIEFVENFKGE